MRTSEEMYNYCQVNGFTSGGKGKALKSFAIIEQNLLPDETVRSVFMGMHDGSVHSGYAITDRRIIIGQKWTIGENVHIILRDNLNDISQSSGFFHSDLTVTTIGEVFNVTFPGDKKAAAKILAHIRPILFESKPTSTEPSSPAPDSTDELRKFKTLLDDGIITQSEFDEKKKQLLNL